MESSLYLPVKRFLEKLDFEVKGEVCGCDLVALDGGSPTAVVIGELKLTFTLDLVLQARRPLGRLRRDLAGGARLAARTRAARAIRG